MTVDEFARRWRARETSAVEALDDCLQRIRADNARLNAFILVTEETARRQAAAADRERDAGLDRGPLHGVPISIKDLFDIEGTPTTAASRVGGGGPAPRDAETVRRLRHAGAVLVGKTNLHEFAFGTTNEDSAFGPSRHPLDARRSPGGSSGGSAVSLATGMAMATLGTDTGGSIRIPAAICGTVGLKPTLGEIPTDGVVPLSTTLDHVGPLTASVIDAWHLFHALRGGPPVPPRTVVHPKELRLAVLRSYFCDLLDHEVRQRFEEGVEAIRAAGATIEEALIPHAALIAPIYLHLVFADAAPYHAAALDAMPERYTPPVRLRLELARYVLAEDYVRARAGRATLRREVDRALAGYDALLLPTVPIPAPALGEASVDVGGRTEPVRNVMLRLTQLFNITGHPAVSVPCGTTRAGFPCGLQLVGTRTQTDALLHVARAVEGVI
jgi:aspartyl-tRNA(Asn)/glutamyl-tRNA(Gln) amidotransferase subunit A